MKKTVIILVMLIAVLLTASACGSRHTDIIGVTTLTGDNKVVMNSASGDEFVSGSGNITLGEGEVLHLEYELTEGSFDLACHEGNVGLDVFETVDLSSLPLTGEVFGASEISGSGTLDLEAAPGDYTVFFTVHGAVGQAVLTAAQP